MQLLPPLNVPLPLLEKLTAPLGMLPVPEEVSLTVAVQVVLAPRATKLGLQVATVEVERLVAVTAKVALLVLCAESPP